MTATGKQVRSGVRGACVAIALCASMTSGAQEQVDRGACVDAAADRYAVPADLVHAIMRVEGGAAGVVSENTNGSRDLGVMQINSIHLPELAGYGITEAALVEDECLSIQIGAWMLSRSIQASPDFWVGVGRYHSATPALNDAYQKRVWRQLLAIWAED